MKKLFWISTAVVIVLLVLASIVSPSFKPLSVSRATSQLSRDESRVKESIRQMLEEYRGQNQQLMRDFARRLDSAGSAGFDRARNNVPEFVRQVAGFKFCSRLCYAMAVDKVKKTTKAMDMMAPMIGSMVIGPCEEGQAEVVDALNDFLLRLQENDTRFKAGLAELLAGENFQVTDLGLREEFMEKNMQLAQKVQAYAMEKMLVALGTALETAFIGQTIRQLNVALAAVVARFSASVAAGGACAVADGPLPIGDMIGGALAVGGLAWTAYDIHKITKSLPREMNGYMLQMIDDYQQGTRVKALKCAEETLRLCEEGCQEISQCVE